MLTRLHKNLPTVVAVACLLIIIGLMWVPVGLHTSIGLFEEWGAIKVITNRDITSYVPSPASPTRPLRWIPHVTAYYLSPDSHVGYNIYLVTLFALRGVGTFLLMRQLFKNTALGLAVAGLYLVYPADTGWFTFRAITIQTALVLGLFSLYLLTLYWDRPRRWLWLLILGTQTLSLLTYELLYVVFGLAPLLLLWLEGRLTLTRRLVRVSLLWYSTYSILALRFLYLMATGSGGYSSNRVANNADTDNLLDKVGTGVQTMFNDHLNGWKTISDDYLIVSLAIGLIAMVGVGWLMYQRLKDTEESFTWKRYPVLLLAGLIWMMMTYIQYTFVDRIGETFRVYFLPSLGAALIIAVTAHGLTRISRLQNVLFPLCIGILMFVGGQKAIEQNTYYAEQSIRIQRLLSTIVTNVPEPADRSVIVVVDEQEIYQSADILAGRSDHLETALSFVYDKEVKAVICTIDTRRRKFCQFTEEGIVETSNAQEYSRTLPYEDVIIFYTRWDGTISLVEEIPPRYYTPTDNINYDPHSLINADAELPPRVDTFFTCWPFTQCDTLSTTTARAVTSVHVDFSEPVPGGGWEQFRTVALPSRVIIANAANLDFSLVPQQSYQLTFETLANAPDLADRLVVEVNDQPIPLTTFWRNKRLVFSSEQPFFVEEEAVNLRIRLDGNGNLRAFRFISLDITAVP